MKIKPAAFASALITCLLCVGCAPVTVHGKVIASEMLSVIATVESGDPRLEDEGIRDAKISASQMGRQNQMITAVSDKDGVFIIPLNGDGALSHPMTFRVEAEGYIPATVTLPTPTPSQNLLVVLRPLKNSGE